MTALAATNAETLAPAADAVPSWKEAGAWACGLSALFIVVYGACNHVASLRANVPVLYFGWERHLPVVPAMIVPYWSIDLLFFASFFLCTSRRELRTHGRRFVLAILASAAFFLLFPLKFAFDRPDVDGVFGPLFKLLHGVDPPFNLAPSLHVADLCILWPLYVRHTRGAPRAGVKAWLLLIGVSTLLTYQHHLVDLLTGQMLGMACLYVLPDRRHVAETARYRPTGLALREGLRLGPRYALGAGAFVMAAVIVRGWGWALLWPAASLTIVAAGYLKFGPVIFRKSDGRLPLSARWVLGPYLLAAWLSWLFFRPRATPWVRVAPGVVIGRRLSGREARRLIADERVTAVLDLTAEFAETRVLRGLMYRNVPVLDLTTPSPRHLDAAVGFIQEHAANGTVFVHCALGLSRAACVAAAWLVVEGIAPTAGAATASLRRVRPLIVCRDEAVGAFQSSSGT